MRDYLSSLISRNQKPQAQIRPRLGALFEPSPLLGADDPVLSDSVGGDLMRDNQAPETPRQPPATATPSTLPDVRLSSTIQQTPSGRNPTPGCLQAFAPDPATSRPDADADLPAPVAGTSGDAAELCPWVQRTLRPDRPKENPRSYATASPVPPATAPSNEPVRSQAEPQSPEPAKESRPAQVVGPPARLKISPMELTQEDQASESIGPNRVGRLVSTVASPQSRKPPTDAETLPGTNSEILEPAPGRPISSVTGEIGLLFQPPSTIAAKSQSEDRYGVREATPRTIRVSIGRIEVRAQLQETPRPRTMAPQQQRPWPALSLADYLKQRGGSS